MKLSRPFRLFDISIFLPQQRLPQLFNEQHQNGEQQGEDYEEGGNWSGLEHDVARSAVHDPKTRHNLEKNQNIQHLVGDAVVEQRLLEGGRRVGGCQLTNHQGPVVAGRGLQVNVVFLLF